MNRDAVILAVQLQCKLQLHYVSMVTNSGVFLTNFTGLGLETACPGIGQ